MNMGRNLFYLCVVILYCLFDSTHGGPHQRRLLKHLFIEQQHDPLERPVANESDTIPVNINFNLIKIIDCDVKKDVLTVNLWITQKWQDYSLAWTPNDYDNITEISVPDTKIWLPDILLYNNVGEDYENQMKTNVVIQHTGDVLYVAPRIFKASCSFSMASSPSISILLDIQTCTLKFGAWTSDKSRIDLTTSVNETNTSHYSINNEWALTDVSTKHHEEVYECCPKVYQSVALIIKLRRRLQYFPIKINGTKDAHT